MTIMGSPPILRFFEYEHLPLAQQEISRPISVVAHGIARDLENTAHPAELVAGLRKLLEAKDCFVRASLPRGE